MRDGRLEVSDLMAGDWVRSKKWAEIPFKLTSLNANMRYYYGITSKGVLIGPFLIEELEPIPITKEILEKIGFCEKNYDQFILHEDLGYREIYFVLVSTYSKDAFWWTVGYEPIVKIRFFHELQHIFNLRKIYKKIEL